MVETKAKKPVRRTKKVAAANSPVPTAPMSDMENMGSTCGHSGCGKSCQVRFVGPTTSVRDHHIVHAARGASQVWTAAIVAGLAVVLTGALAYTAVQAQTQQDAETSNSALASQLSQINRRLDSVESTLRQQALQAQAAQQVAPPVLQELPSASNTGNSLR